MITNTFQHIPWINASLERHLWNGGMLSWYDVFQRKHRRPLPNFFNRFFRNQICSSISALFAKDVLYFSSRIKRSLHWRLLPHFRDQIVYLDIEATGLECSLDKITVLGTYDGAVAKSFVRGINMDQAVSYLKRYKIWVTYNGSQFDIPFLYHTYRELKGQPVHIDLRILLNKLGYNGGLKLIEEQFGIKRDPELCSVNGAEAVALWTKHMRGDSCALRVLQQYNLEDVVNLENIFIKTYNLMLKQTPFKEKTLAEREKPPVCQLI